MLKKQKGNRKNLNKKNTSKGRLNKRLQTVEKIMPPAFATPLLSSVVKSDQFPFIVIVVLILIAYCYMYKK